jgi:hypothetical protein
LNLYGSSSSSDERLLGRRAGFDGLDTGLTSGGVITTSPSVTPRRLPDATVLDASDSRHCTAMVLGDVLGSRYVAVMFLST